MLDPLAGRLNGFALLQALRPALRRATASPCTSTRRCGACARAREIVLETPEGEVRARALVLATNAYTPALGFFRRGILPLHSHVLATAPLAARRLGARSAGAPGTASPTTSTASPTPAARRAAALLFGGGGNPAYAYRFGGSAVGRRRGDARATRFMRAALTRYFPAPRRRRRSSTAGRARSRITLDRVCSMGVGGEHRNVYHALGYSGHGVALALLAGRVLADLYDGNHEPWRDLPFYQKRLLPIPPEPLRWLGYQAYTRLTGRSPRKTGRERRELA